MDVPEAIVKCVDVLLVGEGVLQGGEFSEDQIGNGFVAAGCVVDVD